MTVTTVADTINPSGGEWASLATWIAACPANLTTAEKSACTTFAVATFIEGETLNFVGSGAVGKLLKTDSTGIGTGTYMVYGITSGNPATSDVITGATSTATCVLTSGTPTGVGVIYQGRVGNCELLTTSNTVSDCSITGITSSATCYVELTADTGCSFVDNPNIRTTALAYNNSNYARCKHTGNNYALLYCNVGWTRINRLQFYEGINPDQVLYIGAGYSGAAVCWLDHLIVDGQNADNGAIVLINDAHKITNSLVTNSYSSAANIAFMADGATAHNCTFAKLGGVVANGLKTIVNYSACGALENIFVGNCTTVTAPSAPASITNCYTSASGPPSGWSAAAFSTATFTNVTAGSQDFRLAAGSALIGAGVTDSVSGTYDISGYAWASPPDVGCWQSPPAAVPKPNMLLDNIW
jgi:hypothetical protein